MSKLIKLSLNKYTIVDDDDYDLVEPYDWYAVKDHNNFYAEAKIQLPFEKRKKNIRLHRFIMNLFSGDDKKCDHRNRNGLDNRRKNLRISTTSQNCANSKKYKNGTASKYKGVSFNKHIGKFYVRLQKDNKGIYLGTFELEKDAAKAYNEGALKYHGEFANLNKIDDY